jgi:DUF1009 family protein
LPEAVAASVGRDGVFVLAIRGMTGSWADAYPHAWLSLGEVGHAFKAFAKAGVDRIVLAGRVDRPDFKDLKLDMRGTLLLPRIVAAARKGDDALLRTMVDIFAAEGFAAVSVADAAPGLLADDGALGRLTPGEDHRQDIAAALAIVRALGALDVGQAAVVCEGLPLAVEAAEGTDAMIARIAGLRPSLRGTPQNKRGVLVKALKPTQDGRTDLPVIGVSTVRLAAEAGLAGIAVEAGKSLVMGKAAVAAEADKLGLFVVGFAP